MKRIDRFIICCLAFVFLMFALMVSCFGFWKAAGLMMGFYIVLAIICSSAIGPWREDSADAPDKSWKDF